MLHNLVFHNDRLAPMEQVRLSPGQAGLINGWGVFSTLRVYDGQPFAFERHWERLNNDARRIQLPLEYSAETVHRQMLQMLKANRVSSGCVRIYFIHNRIGIWCSDERAPLVDLLMYASDLPTRTGSARLTIRKNGRHAAHPLAGVKVTSWLPNAWFLEQAHAGHFDDALLLNEYGNVSECTAANIFCVRGGSVLTPPLAAGCLPGVTRQLLLELAPSAGIPVTEADFTPDEILSAEEVFITSTTRHVQAVSEIDDIRFAHSPGPVTTRLAEMFSTVLPGRSPEPRKPSAGPRTNFQETV